MLNIPRINEPRYLLLQIVVVLLFCADKPRLVRMQGG